jgi:hypothetical protein
MDRGIWATWHDLPTEAVAEYTGWLHERYLPSMLQRSGYLWAAHVENVDWPEREEQNARRLTHIEDPAVPDGFRHLVLFGAANPHTFVDPSPDEMLPGLAEEDRRMLSLRKGERSAIFLELDRVEAPDAGTRRPGITPGPVIQFGTFNINDVANEVEMNTWYSRSRLPLVQPVEGNVGARRVVSIAGWPKHGILYEFSSLDAAQKNLQDPSEWTRKVVDNLVHAPHSPTLGVRVWPAWPAWEA